MLLTMYCVRRDLSEITFTLQVDGGLELETFRVLCEMESGVPAAESQIIFAERPLTDNQLTLAAYGLKDGDVLVLRQLDRPPVQPSLPLPGVTGLPRIDFSGISVPGSLRPRMPESGVAHQQPPTPTPSSSTASPPPVPPPHSLENNPMLLRDMLLANPHELSLLKERNPPLAEALLSGDLDKFIRVLREQQLERARREQERIRLLNADPFDLEAQAKIEEDIRQQNIEENMTIAMEESPESFGQVVMLYINCKVNGNPVKAFVDSGAQMTIMSQACAERCNIMRLVDRRWAGIAKGVGTQKIIGRVHLAQVQIEGDFLPCSFSILEDQPMDMLLGLDMLKRHQCSIDLKRNVLVIGTTGTETRFLPEAELPECARLAYGVPRDDLQPEELADEELAEALHRSAEESGKENGKTTSLESPSLPAPHHLHLPLPITRSVVSQAPQTQSQLDRSLSVPASLPSQNQNKSEFTGAKSLQIPECMEIQAEKQTLLGPLDNLLTPLSPQSLSAPSQASLGKKHIPPYENIHSSSQNPLKHPTSDTDYESLPKRVLPDMSPHEVGMEKSDVTQEDYSLLNVRTKPQQESLDKESSDLEEPPIRKVGELSSTVQPNTDSVFDLGVADRSIQAASPELGFGNGSSNIDEVQQPTETGKGIDDPDIHLQQITEPSDMDLEIDEKDLCSCQKKIEAGEKPSSDSLTGNIEFCDAEIVNSTEQQVEEIRHAGATRTDSSGQKEGKVHISDQEFEDEHLSSNVFIPQMDRPVKFTSGYTREKSDVALDADEKHEEVHLFTEIKPSSYQQDQASDSDLYDSHLSPVATLFELHRELFTSCQGASLKISANSENNCQSEVTNQEERVQPMEVSEECSDSDALSRMCVSAELEPDSVEMEKEPLLTANPEIFSQRDNSVECCNIFTEKLTSDVTQDESEEVFVQETKDEAADSFILVSKDLTNEMEVSPAEESLETQALSVKSRVHTPDTTAAESSQMSQSTETHLQVMIDNVVCSSEVPEVSAAPMMWEETMEADINQPDRHSLDSSLELCPPALSTHTFPAANVERIRRSGFTQQEAVEALERCHGNTDLALLVLLARRIVVPV
ncbi:protein DDI1 homolog 2 isoform X1 [Heptranchias perlo]|uniref:protein DDI1 homolog 2 isoform X1 n=1 Tax=Heptranchias perlo TaxID=212740 RepID=UPI003559644B